MDGRWRRSDQGEAIMPIFEIQGPDGKTYEADAPDAQAAARAFSQMANLDKSAATPAAPEPSEGERKAAAKAAADRASMTPGMRTVADKLHQFVKGAIPWSDEIKAAIGTVLPGGGSFDENLAYQVAKGDAADADSTKLGTLPVVGDVTTGGVTKLGGGVASAVATAPINIVRGAALGARMLNEGAKGAIGGALYGSGEDKENRGRGAVVGGGIGAGLGFVAPAVGTGIGNAYQWARNQLSGLPAALQGYSRGAVTRVGQGVADDGLDAAAYQARVAELGPEGMLADMGENLTGHAGAIANQPGRGMQLLRNALDNRHRTAAGRIRGDVDNALGPAANIPETIEATAQHYRAQAAPHRQQFQNNPVPFTPQLENLLGHIQENTPAVLGEARRYANEWARMNGTRPQFFARQNANGGWDIDRIPNATEWDHIKRAFDAMGNGRTASRTDQTIYGDLARTVRNTVDEALSPGAPDQSPWALARALEGENFQIRDAVEAGADAFNKNLTPDQMAAEMYGVGGRGGMTQPALQGYQLGARENVRNIMGNASTQWGENGATAARSRLGSDNAREKLAHIVQNPQAADDLLRRLDAETAFARTRQDVSQNSRTAQRQAAQKLYPNAAAEPVRGDITLPGMVVKGARGLANALFGGAITEARSRVAADAAEMLIAQGAQRDAIVHGLIAHAQTRAVTGAQREAIIGVARALMQGTTAPAVDAAASR
jgi:hypothetical protein